MTNNPSVSIIIPVYNQCGYTRLCLTSLERANLCGAEIVVVDNGSTDDTPTILADWTDGGLRRSLRSDQNLGFARGCNWGASTSKADLIVFLNNDTYVLDGWLTSLVRAFESPGVRVAGSRLLYPNGRIQHAGIAFINQDPRHIFRGLRGSLPLVSESRDYQAVTGASLAIRREEFERLGGFDEGYLNSFEDIDLCLKVRQAGGRVTYVPGSVAYHWESVTEGRTSFENGNYKRYQTRWKGKLDDDLNRLEADAVAAGYSLNDRIPSLVEIRYEESLRAQERERHQAELQRRVHELQRRERELESRLEYVMSMRSVQNALRLRNAYRRVIPSGAHRHSRAAGSVRAPLMSRAGANSQSSDA